MRFTMVAVAAGLLIGHLGGGRLEHIGDRSFRFWPVLAAGVVLQAVSGPTGGEAGGALLLASYGLLLAFAAANVLRVGMWMVALGIALNFLVIAVNGGMPVRPTALVAAGVVEPGQLAAVSFEGKRHLERPSDRLLVLSDAVPVRALREVVSFGDVALAVGVADVVVHLMRPPRRRAAPPGPRHRAPLLSHGW